VIDPRLFSGLPFNNKTAWLDFLGVHDLYWKQGLIPAIQGITGNSFKTYPLGGGGGADWLSAVQQTYQNAALALGVSPPPDLQSYDLGQASDFASWTFIISQELRRLSLAAGLA
jgi:hypothetical protein